LAQAQKDLQVQLQTPNVQNIVTKEGFKKFQALAEMTGAPSVTVPIAS